MISSFLLWGPLRGPGLMRLPAQGLGRLPAAGCVRCAQGATGLWPEGCGIALSGDEYICRLRRQRCRRQRKPNNRACSALEMHPYPRLRRYFHLKVKRLTTFCASLTLLQNVFAVHPGGGSLLYSQLLNSSELISISRHKGAKTSPSGGGAVGRRGAFQTPAGRFACFPPGEARLYGFLSTAAINSN